MWNEEKNINCITGMGFKDHFAGALPPHHPYVSQIHNRLYINRYNLNTAIFVFTSNLNRAHITLAEKRNTVEK